MDDIFNQQNEIYMIILIHVLFVSPTRKIAGSCDHAIEKREREYSRKTLHALIMKGLPSEFLI